MIVITTNSSTNEKPLAASVVERFIAEFGGGMYG